MKIICSASLLKLGHTELKLLLCLIKHVDNDNEYYLNAKVKGSVCEQSGLKEQTVRVTNSLLVRNGIVVRIKNGWYKIKPEIMRKV